MHRPALTLCSLTAVAALLAGCGGSDDSTSTESASEQSPTPTQSTSASATASSGLKPGCTPPKKDLEFSDGSASLDVTSGPDQGHYDLALDSSQTNAFASDDLELTGNWISSDKKAVLFIDIEGSDPCTPDAFTRIGTQGANGPVFIDGGHNQCSVELTSLSTDGAAGTFECNDLMGGGEGLERDANGSFTLLS